MADKEQIVREVHKALDEIHHRWVVDWTKEVKTALCKACKKCNRQLKLYANGVDKVVDNSKVVDGGEWLYDVTCLLHDAGGYIKRFPLVAESEWGSNDDVHDDFEKLLLARAEVRVMVFDGRRYGTENGSRFEEFAKYIDRCDRTETGDIYILAAWMPGKFEYCRRACQELRV